jgi:hypothetical protein
VIEDFILCVVDVSVLLLVDGSLNVVFVHELIEFIKLDNAILILVNFLEQSSDFVLLEAHVKEAWEVHLEALQGQVA